MDRRGIERLVGRKVAVRLNSVEARGVEMIATLDEVREDGIVLSEVGELGSGPTMFCPWYSLRRVRERPSWLRPPHEDRAGGETYDLRYTSPIPPEEAAVPEPPVERRRSPSARTLERVVPIAQKQTVGEITLALVSLEIHGEGLGVLRYLVSYTGGMFDGGYGIPMPELIIGSGSADDLPWAWRGNGSSDGEAYGEVEVADLPGAGEVAVEALRVASWRFDNDAGEEVVEESYDGPWSFRFSL